MFCSLSHLDASFHLLAATGDWAAWLCSTGNNEHEITITKCVSSSPALISCRIFGSSHLHRGKELPYKNAPLPALGQGKSQKPVTARLVHLGCALPGSVFEAPCVPEQEAGGLFRECALLCRDFSSQGIVASGGVWGVWS